MGKNNIIMNCKTCAMKRDKKETQGGEERIVQKVENNMILEGGLTEMLL